MSHSRVIILGALDDMIGDGTNGTLVLLRTNFVAADDYIAEGMDQNKVDTCHTICEQIQETLIDGNYSSVECGFSEAVTTWNSQIGALEL